jgi:hypothetical protein
VFRFTPLPAIRFGRQAQKIAEPKVGPQSHTTRASLRRGRQLHAAGDVLAYLPADGEALHCLQSALFDLTTVLVLLVDKLGTCTHMRIATLAFSKRNLEQLLALFDNGQVKRITFLGSTFYRNYNPEDWKDAVKELRDRGQRIAVYTNHAKVVALDFMTGPKLVIEGSSNLRSNRSLEAFVITHDAGLHDWTAKWIDHLVALSEADDEHQSK